MKSLRQRSYLCFLSAPVSQNLLFITTNNPSIPLRAKDIFPYKRDTDVTNIHCINSTKNGEIIKSWTEITRRRAIGPACVCCLWTFSSAAVYFLLFILFVCLFVCLFLLQLCVGALNERNERKTIFQARPLFVLAEQSSERSWILYGSTSIRL